MRTCASVVLLATFVAACGGGSGNVTPPNVCAGAVDGMSCGNGQLCRSGMCVAATCGDGLVTGAEECDDRNVVAGDGCETNCRYTCLASDASRNCAPADSCAGQGVCTAAHVCMDGTSLPDGTSCGTGQVCVSEVCTSTACGNGTREFGEDCDDGNTANLDGCDRACKFEQVARVTSLQQQFATEPFCTKNALGGAITAIAQQIIQATWDTPVADGSLSLVFEFLGFIDPSGARSAFELGFLDALPIRFNPQEDGTFADNYSGLSDLDWWYYLRDPATVDATGRPVSRLAGEVTNRHLTAGPGTINNLRLLFALEPTSVTLFNVKIDATFDPQLTKPKVSTTGKPAGHLPSENLSPDFSTFESSGVAPGSTLGALCSDVSLKSLADTRLPGLLALCADPSDPTGSTPAFSVGNPDRPDNHLLDVFIVGCQFFSFDAENNPAFVPAISPTQPDSSRDGSTYVFAADPVTHQVTSCTKDGQPAALDGCYANATYSSYFKFAASRVMLRADKPAVLP
jgi:cysteine-rich repeat protein